MKFPVRKVFRFSCRGRTAKAKSRVLSPKALCRKAFGSQAPLTFRYATAEKVSPADYKPRRFTAKARYNAVLLGQLSNHAHQKMQDLQSS